MSHEFHTLKVKRIIAETERSKSIYFDIPENLTEAFKHRAGQHLTFKLELDGREVRRCYSICTSPHEKEYGVNVKRVDKGLVSNHICDKLNEGDIVEVMEPDGKFTIDLYPDKERDFYFFAAGSGITPIISLIKSILEDEPKSRCYLCYGNRNESDIIFKDQLEKLEKRYSGQLFIRHTLSRPLRQKEKGLKGIFSRGKSTWTGWKGRISKAKINQFLEDFPKRGSDAHYFICGPGAMIDTIVTYMESLDIPISNLHREYFIVSAAKPSPIVLAGGVTSKVKVHLEGNVIDIEVPPEKTILDVLIEEQYDPPYSCTSGACATCIGKIIRGKVEMDACYALDEGEISEGYVLVCQSRAKTEEVELQFEG